MIGQIWPAGAPVIGGGGSIKDVEPLLDITFDDVAARRSLAYAGNPMEYAGDQDHANALFHVATPGRCGITLDGPNAQGPPNPLRLLRCRILSLD